MTRRLLAVAVCMAFAASPALAAKPFTPKTVAGTWTGTWSNQTFGSTGTITLSGKTLKKGKAFQFNVDLGGNALGCTDPAAEHTPTIKKGKGDNHWNAKGFRLHLSSQAYGTFSVKYVQKTHKLTGSGGNPPCAPGVTWKLDGKLTKTSFTGSVTISLPGNQTATSTLTANRQ
ncbi:MAG TPA: hypothetical protein VH817_03965 [Thermoleophilaceae bacterium]